MNVSNKIKYILVLILVFIFGGFFLKYKKSLGNKTKEKENQNSIQKNIESKLSIDDKKCIGCGHCVKFAKDNFQMDYSAKKAKVISQENINSSSVKTAVSVCPTKAISL